MNFFLKQRWHTKRSDLSACMYLSMKSRIVNHSAVKVESDCSGVRWCKNTYKITIFPSNNQKIIFGIYVTFERTVAPLILVSSKPAASSISLLLGSRSLARSGKRTWLKHDSHSEAARVCKSGTRSARCRYVIALVLTCNIWNLKFMSKIYNRLEQK